MHLILPLVTGFICGCVFSLFKLPIPAPTALAGVLGVVGIWLGFETVRHFQMPS